MNIKFWGDFCLHLLAILGLMFLMFLGIYLVKKVFIKNKTPLLDSFVYYLLVSSFLVATLIHLLPYCKDIEYMNRGEFIEIEGRIEEFAYKKRDLDGNGQLIQKNPRVFVFSTQQYIVVKMDNVDNIEIGETYKIRYLPNTKIAEVIEKVE